MFYQLNQIGKWWSNTNQATALIGIVMGIVFKFIYDYYIRYVRARNKPKVRFDWKGLGLTALMSVFLSIIMYSGLLSAVAELKSDLLVLSVSAQNGFFWQTIIGRLGEQQTNAREAEFDE